MRSVVVVVVVPVAVVVLGSVVAVVVVSVAVVLGFVVVVVVVPVTVVLATVSATPRFCRTRLQPPFELEEVFWRTNNEFSTTLCDPPLKSCPTVVYPSLR